jgi:hypothetical protein
VSGGGALSLGADALSCEAGAAAADDADALAALSLGIVGKEKKRFGALKSKLDERKLAQHLVQARKRGGARLQLVGLTPLVHARHLVLHLVNLTLIQVPSTIEKVQRVKVRLLIQQLQNVRNSQRETI